MPKYPSISLVIFLICLYSCQSKENKNVEIQKYPNQDAPLALLMREMFEDLDEIKQAVSKGQSIKAYVEKHQMLLSAEPTNPEVRSITFQVMGEAYLEGLRALESSPPELLNSNYQVVLSTCLACHQQYCLGPIKRINLLQIE